MNGTDIIIMVAAAMGGGLIGVFLHGKITKDVKVVLAFSGAYLLALSVIHLMPEIYHTLDERAGLFILCGFLLQIAMDYFSKGVEHGHVHRSDQLRGVFPLGIFISLFLHSFIEGLPLASEALTGHDHAHAGSGHVHAHTHGGALLVGIAIHKVPEAIALAVLLYHYFERKSKTLLMLAIYAMATPLGMWAGHSFIANYQGQAGQAYAIMLAIAVGIFLHVSTTIIFEAEEHHRFNVKKGIAIVLGLALVWISTAL